MISGSPTNPFRQRNGFVISGTFIKFWQDIVKKITFFFIINRYGIKLE